ncbi:MAG: zinc-dependent alcohol dehydrogenase family protein [Firmicutes bacterium]|nr:zinc-dependent alcohol dehydrogenase family protein [Bacillota bacterium]
MKALVYHGPGQKVWEEVPNPQIQQPTDAIVRMDTTTICGSDLHILKGDTPEVIDGRVLGHEGIGTIVSVGSAVHNFREGDRVLISCISACGRCEYCRKGMYGQCLNGGGWILGHLIDGTQAEYVRIPFADNSLYRVPEQLSNEQVLFLSDILPTGYEVGVLKGVVQPGQSIAVIGAGPVGLAAILTAQLYSPMRIIALDMIDARLEKARVFGATDAINNGQVDAVEAVRTLTDGLGVDVAIEAVGIPATFELTASLVRPGGRIANIGVHGKPVTLHLEQLWIRDVTITTGLVDTFTIPTLLRMVESGRLPAEKLATHRFALDQMMEAYDTFLNASQTNALKVVLNRA